MLNGVEQRRTVLLEQLSESPSKGGRAAGAQREGVRLATGVTFYFGLPKVEDFRNHGHVETPAEQAPDLADLIRRIMDEHNVTRSGIAARIGSTTSTVSAWTLRKRGAGSRGPNPDKLRALAEAFGIPEREVFAAAGRKVPGPLSPDKNERVLAVFAELTAEQQAAFEAQMKAVADLNRTNP